MKILALDQSTNITGYAVLDSKNGDLIKHGVIDLHKEKDTWERTQIMRQQVDLLVKENKPKVVLLEDVAMQRDVQAVIKLGRLQGLLMASALSRNIHVLIYLPSQWRKILGIKQGAGVKRPELKAQAKQLIQDVYGLEPTEDEADAACIGLAFLVEQGHVKWPIE